MTWPWLFGGCLWLVRIQDGKRSAKERILVLGHELVSAIAMCGMAGYP
jgi:hypothetical protein